MACQPPYNGIHRHTGRAVKLNVIAPAPVPYVQTKKSPRSSWHVVIQPRDTETVAAAATTTALFQPSSSPPSFQTPGGVVFVRPLRTATRTGAREKGEVGKRAICRKGIRVICGNMWNTPPVVKGVFFASLCGKEISP